MGRGCSRLFLAVALAALVGCLPREPAATANHKALIERVDRLVDTFLRTEDDAGITAVMTEARGIFGTQGVPAVATVGDATAYGFVLINMLGQPPDVRREFFAAVEKAATRGELPEDALVFAQAYLRQAEVEDRFREHVPTDPALRDRIARLYADDQTVRQKEEFDPKKMEEMDRRSAGPLRAIFNRYGVPTFDTVGPEAASNFVTMVQHQSPAFRQAVLPKLKANVDAGQADAGNYAMVYDRTQRDQGKNQLYGQQLECASGKALELAPLDDPANVNRRRAELGLMRVELYAQLVRAHSPDMCGAASSGQ